MSERERPIADESRPLPAEPSGADEGPAAGGAEQPSPGRRRFALPSIDRAREWARAALAAAQAAAHTAAPAARQGLKLGIGVVVVSVALGTASFVTASFYGQYGAIRNTPNAQGWSGLTPRFAGQAICVSCHAPETGAQAASIHVSVSCEACHGPAAAHSRDAAAARTEPLISPTSDICVTCHAVTAGRPAAFAQIDPVRHFAGGQCLRCHDPHSIVAFRPPTVSHPLGNLPQCTTCHAPDGLKKIPTGHEIVGDSICLSCHGSAADESP